MKTIYVLAFGLLALVKPLSAVTPSVDSAVRFSNETFQQAEKRYLKNLEAAHPQSFATEADTAHGSATTVDQLKFEKVPQWTNTQITDAFESIRDERFLTESSMPNFLRRISWLYPHDGCFARAALFASQAEDAGLARPARMFVFGGLKVTTDNAAGGYVSWWYHVVPLVKNANNEPVVFDPAIDPNQPLALNDWFKTMVKDTKGLKASVCSPHSYVPYSPCLDAAKDADATAAQNQSAYLRAEWSNLKTLGRNPEAELGDAPPWM